MKADAAISYLDDALGDLAIVVQTIRKLSKQEYPDAEDIEDCMADLETAKDKLDLAYMELDDWHYLEKE